MNDPRAIAQRLLGTIDWQTEVTGYCRCPGEARHTHPNRKQDCRVHLDGAPTIFCFHSSCLAAVAEANRRLRRELGASPWAMTLPGGRILRSGEVLQKDGTVLPKATAVAGSRVLGPNTARQQVERHMLASIRMLAERFRPDLFEIFHWPYQQILAESPLQVAERDAEDQFRTWLRLWPAHCHVWIGDVSSTGQPKHRTHFRPVSDWYQIGPVMGNYTCSSAFKPGSYRRSNMNLDGQRFLVVESDTLGKDEVGAIFAYLRRRLHYRLHCIIDTAGKSLHGWFQAPSNAILEGRLKAGLEVLGCDPKVFTHSQPVRVPGAWRNGKLQKLVWLEQ